MTKKRASQGGLILLNVFLGGLLCFSWASSALAQDLSEAYSLTQADIDAYVYLLPRLTADVTADAARAGKLMAGVGMNKKRLIYVGAKVAIAQAMAIGAMTPKALDDHNVPLYLHPSPEEVSLVNTNLHSLTMAQEMARRAASGVHGPL